MDIPSRVTATIQGWLLLLPAMALLALFTHWPALATFIDSLYSTPRPRRPARYIGLDNYQIIVSDPVFWQSLWNNLLFALGTIPISITLARRGGRARRRLALDIFSPRAISPADADHAVRADQRGDQRVPHRRPHHRNDARRAGQRHHAAALLHLSGRFSVLGYDLCGFA